MIELIKCWRILKRFRIRVRVRDLRTASSAIMEGHKKIGFRVIVGVGNEIEKSLHLSADRGDIVRRITGPDVSERCCAKYKLGDDAEVAATPFECPPQIVV